MKAGNWYYTVVRHTRSDRTKDKDVKLEVNIDGFTLTDLNANKSMKITMSDEEIDFVIERMQTLKVYKQK